MTETEPRRAGWIVWALFVLGLLATPVDVILALIVGAIAMSNGSLAQGADGVLNAACMVIVVLAIGLIAAMVMRRRRLVMVLGGLLLAPVVLLGGVLILGLTT